MFSNIEVFPLDKLALDNEGYHDPVERDDYLNPSGEDIPEKLKQETSLRKSDEDLKKGQNGKAGIRPKNSRFDSGKFVFNPYPAVHDNLYLCKQCRSRSDGF